MKDEHRQQGRDQSLEVRQAKVKQRQKALLEAIKDIKYVQVALSAKLISILYNDGEFPDLHNATGGSYKGFTDSYGFWKWTDTQQGNYPIEMIRKDLNAIKSQLAELGLEVRSYENGHVHYYKYQIRKLLQKGAYRDQAIAIVAQQYPLDLQYVIGLYRQIEAELSAEGLPKPNPRAFKGGGGRHPLPDDFSLDDYDDWRTSLKNY